MTPAASQERRPIATVTGGLGNVLGGFGAAAEFYFAEGRLSAAAGLGYWPAETLCDKGTLSGAGALRGFIGGPRHRGFLELSYSLVQVSCPVFGGGELQRYYGPGLSLGYRYTASSGFTFSAGAGGGDGSDGLEIIILLGLGYTWQR